jgi:polysaccharide pyruvyl transferase CsaB
VSTRILIAGYMGYGNTGDEAIAQVMTDHLREAVPDAELTIISGNPQHTAAAYGVRVIGCHEPLAIAEAIRDTDLTIIGGGGLFQDYWGVDPDSVFSRERRGLGYYVAPALLSTIYGKPVMLYAVGVGPLLSEHGRRLTRVAADIAARITVRDAGSRDLLQSLGVSPAKITLTADPVFDFTPSADAAGLPEVLEWRSGGPAIAVCLRNWNFGVDQSYCERQIALALDELIATEGARVLLIPFQPDSTGTGDPAVARGVYDQLRHRQQAAVLTAECPPAALAGLLASANLVLGMRLHSIIFAISAQVPFVALEYDPKVGGAAELGGFEEFNIALGALDAPELADRMRQALAAAPAFRERTEPLLPELRHRAKRNAEIAADLVRQPGPTGAYGPDTRDLMGRMVLSQIAANESLIERLLACCRTLEIPTDTLRAVEIANSVLWRVNDLAAERTALKQELAQLAGLTAEADRERANRAAEAEREIARLAAEAELEHASRAAEADQEHARQSAELQAAYAAQRQVADENFRLARALEAAQGELERATAATTRAEEEIARLIRQLRDLRNAHRNSTAENLALTAELQQARQDGVAARERLESETRKTRELAAAIEETHTQQRLTELQSKTAGGIAKHATHVFLDALQFITPRPVRELIRKPYLNLFYYRLYPERRPGGTAPRS